MGRGLQAARVDSSQPDRHSNSEGEYAQCPPVALQQSQAEVGGNFPC
jgi:hypothetical protein